MTWRSWTLAAAMLGLAVACSGEKKPFPGALMLAIQTDLTAPKDFSAIGLYITSDGKPVFSDTRDIAPSGEVKLPATLAIIGDENRPRAVVKIRVIAFKQDGNVRVLRDIVTTVPKDRTALLRAPLLWINEGSGTGQRSELSTRTLRPRDTLPDGFTRITSACPDGQTFLEGECGDANVDSSTLPDFVEADVFGGGNASGEGGRCFDVAACFAESSPVSVDNATCSASLAGTGVDANDPNLSFAISLPAAAATGECNGASCLVPLDKGASTGWQAGSTPATVTFARALCNRITSGKALGIVRTTRCAAKDAKVPSCGPASAVSSSGTNDAGAGGDATLPGTQDFDPTLVLDGEPNLSAVAVDSANVYVARSATNAGVAKIARNDVLARTSPLPSTPLFTYAVPQRSMMLLGPKTTATNIVVRGESGELRVCTPASAGDCPSFVVNGPLNLALGPTDAFAFGDNGGPPGIFSVDLGAPALVARASGSLVAVAAMLLSGGTLYLGKADGAIEQCTAPCQDLANVSTLRAAPAGPSIVTALAADDRVPGKIFFMQVPADGATLANGGIFEIGTSGSGEQQIAPGGEILGSGPPPLLPPNVLAVDSQYLYWGGVVGSSGLVRKNHVTRTASELFAEDQRGTESPSGVAVDDAHVFWTYDRANRALALSRKKRAF